VHELSVTQGILDVVLEVAPQHNARHIKSIDLVIGDLSGYVDDSIQFYFDILSRDTLAEGATLIFRRIPATASCLACGHQFRTGAPLLPLCPACDGTRLQVTGGKELYVDSIEVDDENSSS
jgi:hydrogenase nickel incorporation protein HypA/HybF